MFVVKTIKISKKYSNQNRIVLLFDTSTTLPCLMCAEKTGGFNLVN
ncbi:hypothetical protein ACINWCA92_3606 [Acinetobacter baumannii WC-A-92]|nr:hypothetical protein ACINWCA92_3606 [Acinetobacter baumannii WC-A-92]